MTIMTEALKASLGDYDAIGFTLTEPDTRYLELKFMGKHVDYFHTDRATIAGIREACQEYLKRNEF